MVTHGRVVTDVVALLLQLDLEILARPPLELPVGRLTIGLCVDIGCACGMGSGECIMHIFMSAGLLNFFPMNFECWNCTHLQSQLPNYLWWLIEAEQM